MESIRIQIWHTDVSSISEWCPITFNDGTGNSIFHQESVTIMTSCSLWYSSICFIIFLQSQIKLVINLPWYKTCWLGLGLIKGTTLWLAMSINQRLHFDGRESNKKSLWIINIWVAWFSIWVFVVVFEFLSYFCYHLTYLSKYFEVLFDYYFDYCLISILRYCVTVWAGKVIWVSIWVIWISIWVGKVIWVSIWVIWSSIWVISVDLFELSYLD